MTALVAVVRRGARPGALAIVEYASTPVGGYREALVAELAGPASVRVAWMVVDLPASVEAGRRFWALPKALARFPDVEPSETCRVVADPEQFEVAERPLGPTLPVLLVGRLAQPGRGSAAGRFRGRIRPAEVTLDGLLPCGIRPGRRPGCRLTGVLTLNAPAER